MVMDSYQWNTREKKKIAGIREVDTATSLASQAEALSKKINNFSITRMASVMHYEGSRGGHSQNDCPIVVRPSRLVKQLDFVGNAMSS